MGGWVRGISAKKRDFEFLAGITRSFDCHGGGIVEGCASWGLWPCDLTGSLRGSDARHPALLGTGFLGGSPRRACVTSLARLLRSISEHLVPHRAGGRLCGTWAAFGHRADPVNLFRHTARLSEVVPTGRGASVLPQVAAAWLLVARAPCRRPAKAANEFAITPALPPTRQMTSRAFPPSSASSPSCCRSPRRRPT